MEEWKEIPGIAGYEVSNTGRVRSITRTISYKDGRYREFDGGIKSQSPSGFKGKYLGVQISIGSKVTRYYVHRLVAIAFLGPIPDGEEVCHIDDNPRNNHISNLKYGTHTENCQDRIRNGGQPRGVKQVGAKLTDAIVSEMRQMYRSGLYFYTIADHFRVARMTVFLAVRGRTWTHVTEPPVYQSRPPASRKKTSERRRKV